MLFHDVQQNTPMWEALRIGKQTCSNNAKIMANDGKAFGEPAQRYALQIALEIETGRKAEFSFSNDDTERGHLQEPIARMLYQDSCFIDVSNGGFFDWGTWGDSPDGLVGTKGVIEIKSVIAPVHYATIKRKSFDPAYRWQLIGHLDSTGRDYVDFVSYCSDFPEGRQLFIDRLERKDYTDDIERLRFRRSEFLALVAKTLAHLRESA